MPRMGDIPAEADNRVISGNCGICNRESKELKLWHSYWSCLRCRGGVDRTEAKKILLDLASYAKWRKKEKLPDSLSDERVVLAIESIWPEVFGRKMEACDKAGMHFPK